MTDFAKVQLTLEVSANSSFAAPYIAASPTPGNDDLQPSEAMSQTVRAATTGTTVEITEFGTPSYVVVHNTDATNFVNITYTSNVSGGNSNLVKVPANRFCVLTDVGSDLTVTADTSVVACRIYVVGS